MITAMIDEPKIRDGRSGDVEAMGWARSEEQRAEWRRQLARGESGEVDFLVIEVGDRIVGKVVLDWTHSPDGTPWLWLGSIDPDHRSRGLGGLGLAEAERRARDRAAQSLRCASMTTTHEHGTYTCGADTRSLVRMWTSTTRHCRTAPRCTSSALECFCARRYEPNRCR